MSVKGSSIPGLPSSSDKDGNLCDIANAGSLHEFLLHLHKQFGPIASFWVGKLNVVSIASAELFEEHQYVFDRPPELFEIFKPLLGEKSIQFANGQEGQARRRHYDNLLNSEAVKHFLPQIQEIADETVEKLETKTGEPLISLQQIRSMISLNALLKTLFGESVTDDDTVLAFKKAYDVACVFVISILVWALYHIAKNPDVDRTIYEEITTVLGEKNVDDTDIKDLVYMRHVLDETLRFSVIAPWGARFQDTETLLGGYTIPKGTPVIQAFGVAFMDEKIWTNTERFDPERFNGENSQQRSKFWFSPFGFAGNRKCPAEDYAYAEATVAIVTLLRKFKFHLADANQSMTSEYGHVTHPKEDIWITISHR